MIKESVEGNKSIFLSSMKEEKSLNSDAITINGLMKVIPVFGGMLSTLYFGYKQESRFRKLEFFYESLKIRLDSLEEKLNIAFDEHDKESLVALIDEIHEKVEREHRKEKIELLQSFFLNTLKDPTTINNYDVKYFYLNTLHQMTLQELSILKVFNNSWKRVYNDNWKNLANIQMSLNMKIAVDYSVLGSVTRLKSYGFIQSQGKDNYERFNLTNYGQDFIKFIEGGDFFPEKKNFN